jgi:DNA-binding response OmpR family regulator
VIADDRMPGIPGSRALRQLRDEGWSIPLVLITAFGTEELVANARKFRGIVLNKPFEIDDLRTLVGWLVPRIDPNACIACGGTNDVRALTDRGSGRFCKSCRDKIEGFEPPSELGGES